jgi:hypothetical protein
MTHNQVAWFALSLAVLLSFSYVASYFALCVHVQNWDDGSTTRLYSSGNWAEIVFYPAAKIESALRWREVELVGGCPPVKNP